MKIRGKNQIITESEAIENALEQENSGIIPHYSWYDYKKKRDCNASGLACLEYLG